MLEIDSKKIIELSRGRAILETELCKRMYHVYNNPPIILRLRELISLAIEQICGLALADSGRSELLWINAIKKAGANLAVWEKYAGTKSMLTVKNLMKMLDHSNKWTASDCSDFIRLFGGIIEDETLQNHGHAGKDVDAFRKQQRVGPGFGADQRSRSKGAYRPNLPHIGAAHNAVLQFKRAKGFSGFKKINLNDDSTVKKMDSTFGLAEGCDISGTTADSIFFIRHVNAFIEGLSETLPSNLVPIIQLLPMATMASQGHHTILECTLTLTLNEIIQYRIGFYNTLTPIKGIISGALQGLFNAAENDARNKHILCFWENNSLRGILYERKDEIDLLRQKSLANEMFRSQFINLPLRPTKAQLFALPSLFGLPH